MGLQTVGIVARGTPASLYKSDRVSSVPHTWPQTTDHEQLHCQGHKQTCPTLLDNKQAPFIRAIGKNKQIIIIHIKVYLEWILNGRNMATVTPVHSIVVPCGVHTDHLVQLLRGVTKEALQVADEAVHVALPGSLVDDVLVVVVAEPPAQLLVVHLGLVLALAPPPRHLVRVGKFELPAVPGPADDVLTRSVCQKLKQELPELNRTTSCKQTKYKYKITTNILNILKEIVRRLIFAFFLFLRNHRAGVIKYGYTDRQFTYGVQLFKCLPNCTRTPQ